MDNEYNRLLFDSLPDDQVVIIDFSWKQALLGRWDIIHVHWPEALLASSQLPKKTFKQLLFVLLLVRIRLRRLPSAWTVHNPDPHESKSRIDARLIRSWATTSRLHIHLTRHTLGSRPGNFVRDVVIPHGTYSVSDDFPLNRRAEIESARLLYFGHVRPYKGVQELLASFERWASGAYLRIVGSPWSFEYANLIQHQASGIRNVSVELRRVSDDELEAELADADGVVLPYRTMVNSGAALMALSHRRAVLVPSSPTTRDLALEVGPRWVTLFEGEISEGDLQNFLSTISNIAEDETPDLSSRRWDDIGQQHMVAFVDAIEARL